MKLSGRFRLLPCIAISLLSCSVGQAEDLISELQASASSGAQSEWGHWGTDPSKYGGWTTHSNRLIPVYTYGGDLKEFKGTKSPYRDADAIKALYGKLPKETLNPRAEYFDQTAIYELQKRAIQSGKRRVILFVFDGMDWQTSLAAACFQQCKVPYQQGKGRGLHFLDYAGTTTDFGMMVTSPHNDGTKVDVDAQTVLTPGGTKGGGYSSQRGGETPWSNAREPGYLIAKSRDCPHAYTDSASSATSMTTGIKTFNNAINFDVDGKRVTPLARDLQREGYSIGVVTSVPISHATPAAAYANNVTRNDYQDLTRDLLGLPSVANRDEALPGVEVLLGCGWGENTESDAKQGANFVPGNKYLTEADLRASDVANGGRYTVALRTAGVRGDAVLAAATKRAIASNSRLLGYFGVKRGHLPFATSNGDYQPVAGAYPAETYSAADVRENPTLAEMTESALEVLNRNEKGFWLMVEAGDVDWANHDDNIDNSIGAVLSGDAAFRKLTNWIEQNGGWDDTFVIVTADHGHMLMLPHPEVIAKCGCAADDVPMPPAVNQTPEQ